MGWVVFDNRGKKAFPARGESPFKGKQDAILAAADANMGGFRFGRVYKIKKI
jgi:hypothetical protein